MRPLTQHQLEAMLTEACDDCEYVAGPDASNFGEAMSAACCEAISSCHFDLAEETGPESWAWQWCLGVAWSVESKYRS